MEHNNEYEQMASMKQEYSDQEEIQSMRSEHEEKPHHPQASEEMILPSAVPITPQEELMESGEDAMYPLKFNDFTAHAVQTFSLLNQRPELYDVTLLTQGQAVGIRAHKIVLSAGSRFFDGLFKTTPNLPIVFMRKVNHSDLEAIVQYLYTGEVRVPESSLQSVLALGNDLKITGLCKVDDEEQMHLATENPPENFLDVNRPVKNEQELPDEEEEEETGTERQGTSGSSSAPVTKDDISILKDGTARCMVCAKVLSSRASALRHLKTTHLESEKVVTCAIKNCGKQFKGGEEKMKAHLRTAHKIYQKSVAK